MAKLQDSPANCGALALVNCLDVLGEKLGVRAAETLAKTHAVTGTGLPGMKSALRKLDKNPHEFQVPQKHGLMAWSLLTGFLTQGYPVLITVQDDEHWVVAVGLLGGGSDRVLVVDSADGAVVKSLTYAQLMPWWRGSENSYYGIAVCP